MQSLPSNFLRHLLEMGYPEDFILSPGALQKKKPTYEEKRSALAGLYYKAAVCHGCALSGCRKRVVFGSGNAGARLMVVGGCPSAEDDVSGLPFTGSDGQLLTKMLSAIDHDRGKDVFLTSVVKCKTPRGREPTSEELTSCLPLLKKQIQVIIPKAILFLGRTAAALFGEGCSIGGLRTQTLLYEGVRAFASYHPGDLLKDVSLKARAWGDLQKVQQFLKYKRGKSPCVLLSKNPNALFVPMPF